MKIKDSDLEQLIELAKSESSEPHSLLSSVERFMQEYPIEPGDKWTPTEIIYHFYLKFCVEKNLTPVYIRKFFLGFKDRGYKKHYTAFDCEYKINPTAFQLTKEELLELQRQRRYYKYLWLPRTKNIIAGSKKYAKQQREKKQQEKQNEKLRKKQDRETKLKMLPSTDESSQK